MSFIIKQHTENPLYKKFKEKLEERYQNELRNIINKLNNGKNFITKKEQIKNFYDWFVKNIEYDYDILKNRRQDGNFSLIVYEYEGFKIGCNEKYAPMFLKKGVCISFSLMFKDFCDLIGVECRVVSGDDPDVVMLKNKPHAWDEIILDGKKYTIDLDPTYRTFLGKPRTKPTFIIKNSNAGI